LRRTLAEAIPIARQRGTIQMNGRGPENLFDFTIVSPLPIAFVRVSYCAQIFAPAGDLSGEFNDELSRLRMIVRHDSVSRELWVRSRQGKWRFFRLAANHLVELGRDGRPLAEKPLQAC
jgi:hypothetical protein